MCEGRIAISPTARWVTCCSTQKTELANSNRDSDRALWVWDGTERLTGLGGLKATACQGRGYVPAVAGRMALLVYLLDLHRSEHCWGEVRAGMVVLVGFSSGIQDMDGWVMDGWVGGMEDGRKK